MSTSPPTAECDVSVILVNYNTAHLLERCIGDLRQASEGLRVQTLIVDNASKDDSLAVIRACLPDCELIVNTVNVGFGRANNQALPRCAGRYVLLLNTDAFVSPDTLRRTVAEMDADPACGVLGVQLTGSDGAVQPSCRYFPTPWNTFLVHTGLARWFPRARLVDDPHWDPAQPAACDWVPGCYYLVRREVVDRVGLFDPRYFLYMEEVDHCRAVRADGWTVRYLPDTRVIHLGGESAKSDGTLSQSGRQLSRLLVESELLYYRKHGGAAGAAGALAMATLGCAVLAAKAALRARGRSLRQAGADLRLHWRLAFQTGLGRRPLH
jgi:GT2 family glycosyltransferase